MYSVIPGYFLFKKLFFAIGPFINLFVLISLIKFNPTSNDLFIKALDLCEIFFRFFSNSKFMSIKLIFLLFKLFVFIIL